VLLSAEMPEPRYGRKGSRTARAASIGAERVLSLIDILLEKPLRTCRKEERRIPEFPRSFFHRRLDPGPRTGQAKILHDDRAAPEAVSGTARNW